ncbi:hypothetical protein, conserved [Trypanosoma brucei gambiense DAL972]|uniref:Uncharacterized protein n=1 Tax=Trypanosoma brucei gambiense (strain MHOM/CI/86/DAL972) TaxID=679716 RepID=C9ZVR7_TRYB9|nr:hypothetical protein, conserved [Trypanosoma brucei gambiense DAL972]CBH13505.1 hypothetical protein, conserved [Trypanosoma brucei gambiense DAL972]|eukprot:XP_011775782.1 hypothetical protein, conserved [Trypanosoma brucei gambiense DAL972]
MLGSVDDVERFSTLLYSGDKSAMQIATELGWDGFASAMGLQLMQRVLKESVAACSIFFVSQALNHLVTSKFALADLVDLEQMLSCVIVERHKLLDTHNRDALVRLLCSVVKRGFCDAPELQRFPLKVATALTGEGGDYSEELVSLSCHILTVLIDTIGSTDGPNQNLAVNKKTNVVFRDECLHDIFKSVSRCLKRAQLSHNQVVIGAVPLLRQILLFDFTCSLEDITEDVLTTDYPQGWAADLLDQELFAKLWGLYLLPEGDARLFSPLLESLASLISLRGSLYPLCEDQKARISCCFEVTLPIMTECLHLEDPTVLHEFCRLLNRLKPNFSIEQMCSVSCYEQWIGALADFTHLCFQNWRHARRSFLSLTSTWAKLVGSQSYCKDKRTLFGELAPKVCLSYITSNQEQAVAFARSGEIASFEDYFLDEDTCVQELELQFASQLLRFCGRDTEEHISTLIESHLWVLKSSEHQAGFCLTSIYEQLAWLITLSSSWLRMNHSRSDACPIICKALWACFGVVSYDCERKLSLFVPQGTRRHFHNSLIALLCATWNALLLDRLDDGNGLRVSLQNTLSLKSDGEMSSTVLGLIVDEVMNCAHSCTDETAVEAFALLTEVAQSPTSVAILKTLPHINDRLALDAEMTMGKNSRVYHRVLFLLARIRAQIWLSNGGSQGVMGDIEPSLVGDFKIFQYGCVEHGEDYADALMRATCSWRGAFCACLCQRLYRVLLKRILPNFDVIVQHFQREFGTNCGVQLLRLLDEITENRYRRITSGAHCTEGYLVFRHIGNSMGTVVNIIVKALETRGSQLEAWGIKCLRITFHTGRNLLAGGLCNMGVLRLYADRSLPACLVALWRAMMLVDRERLCQNEKLARSYFMLASELLRDLYLWFICDLPIEHLLQVIHLLEFSLNCQNTFGTLITLGAEAVAAFTSALCCREGHEGGEGVKILGALLRADKNVFSRLLRATLDLITTRKCTTDPFESLLQTLIVLDGDSFVQLGDLFSGLAAVGGKGAEVREAFVLLQQCACESYRQNNKNSFVNGFKQFSTVVTRCLA